MRFCQNDGLRAVLAEHAVIQRVVEIDDDGLESRLELAPAASDFRGAARSGSRLAGSSLCR